MVGLPLVLGLAGLESCSCQPQIPDPVDQTTHSDTSSESGRTGDTGPAPPCDAPELEPNDSISTPNPLPMEKHGCGAIDVAGDADYWSFVLEDDSWLKVQVQHGNGSIADMSFVLTPEDLAWAASRPDDGESLDAIVIFPAPAGTYTLDVSEQFFNGGERYGYDVLVSETKPPIEYTRTEVEPNDDTLHAVPVVDGDRVYGVMESDGAIEDLDWYVITIPAGRHTLNIDVDAFEDYSSADLTVYLYDPDQNKLPLGCKEVCPSNDAGCEECPMKGGPSGGQLDPVGSYDSLGSEVVYILVKEAKQQRGPANWYVLDIGLEGT